MLTSVPRTQLYEIFDPIILDIERLVSEQINEARLKRIMDHHPKGKEITVSISHCRMRQISRLEDIVRLSFLWEGSVRAPTSTRESRQSIRTFVSFSPTMRKCSTS